MMDTNQAKATKQEEMLAEISARIDAKTDANQAELKSIICTFWSELKETIQREMRAAIQSVRSELDETTT
jgi:hypothetical protein